MAYIRENVVTVLGTRSNDPVLGLPLGILNEESENSVLVDTSGRSPSLDNVSLVVFLDNELHSYHEIQCREDKSVN